MGNSFIQTAIIKLDPKTKFYMYNAGQKKRNSELRILRDPPKGGGSTLKTVQQSTTFKVDLPLPGSSQKINGSELRFF